VAPLPDLRLGTGVILGAALGAAVALLEGIGRESGGVLVAAAALYGAAGAASGWLAQRLLPRQARTVAVPGSVATVALLLAAGAVAWAHRPASRGNPPPLAPEIVVVTSDTTRHDRWWAVADHLRASEERGAPWEAGATVFEAAYAPVGLTAPSHATLFTGLHPYQHGVLNNGSTLGPAPRLAELLRSAGYRTLAAPSVIHLDPGFGFARGFDRFARTENGLMGWLRPLQRFRLFRLSVRLFGLEAGRAVRNGALTAEAAEALWRRAAGPRPRFLWVHILEPHRPYDPPAGDLAAAAGAARWPEAATPGYEPRRVEEARRLYDGEIHEARRTLRDLSPSSAPRATTPSTTRWCAWAVSS